MFSRNGRPLAFLAVLVALASAALGFSAPPPLAAAASPAVQTKSGPAKKTARANSPKTAGPARARAPKLEGLSLTDSLRLDPLVKTGVLPNGIRWFIRPNLKPEARVSLRLAVAAGATAEEEDQRGLAHFAEHMNFNGSTHFKWDPLESTCRHASLSIL